MSASSGQDAAPTGYTTYRNSTSGSRSCVRRSQRTRDARLITGRVSGLSARPSPLCTTRSSGCSPNTSLMVIPSSVTIAYSVLTDGLTRSSSICDTRLGETPTRRASSRRPTPSRSRSARSRCPTFDPSRGPLDDAGSLTDTGAYLLRDPPGPGKERVLERRRIRDRRIGRRDAPRVVEMTETVFHDRGEHLAGPAAGDGSLLHDHDPVRLLHRVEHRFEVEGPDR